MEKGKADGDDCGALSSNIPRGRNYMYVQHLHEDATLFHVTNYFKLHIPGLEIVATLTCTANMPVDYSKWASACSKIELPRLPR